jgi:uracil-DNA glycosylase family 4
MVPTSPHDPNATADGRARFAIIGESPGNYEVAKGQVFIGPSGRLLEAVLASYDIKRPEVMLTNSTLCHYPSSKFKKLPVEAIDACQPRLLAEIEESGAHTVIPTGNSALRGIFPKEVYKKGITQLRAGRPKTSSLLPSAVTVVPTFHPAACLRSQEKFPRMLTDFGKAASADSLPTLWYEPDIVIGRYTETLYQILQLNRGSIVIFDIETAREKDISFGNVHMNKLLCVGIGPTDTANKDRVFVFPEYCFNDRTFRDMFRRLIKEVKFVAQNGKFDLGSLRAYLGYADFEGPTLAEDTMLQSYTLFEYSGVHGLEYMGMELLGTPDWKHDITPYLRGPDGKGDVDYANIPKDTLYKYNAFDVHATRLLHDYFAQQLKERGLENAYQFTLRVSNMLTLVEPRGLGFDVSYSEKLSSKLQGESDAFKRNLPVVSDPTAKSKHLQSPHVLNSDSPKQVTKYLDDNSVRVENTEADTLEELLTKPDTVVSEDVKSTIRTILNIRGITKMDGTFVGGMAKRVTEKGTVHPSFLIHGTTSGRLSARNPNSQNIPRAKEIKRQFITRREGNSLVGVDMSQAELRVLTWLARDEGLRAIFNDPSRDLFVELCRMMFPALFADSSFTEVKNHPIRPLVKGAVYGLAYGRTATGIAGDPSFNMTVQEAQNIINKLTQVIPDVILYLEGVAQSAVDGEDLITPFGRHRRFHLVTSLNEHSIRNEAKSFPAQSTASDIVLEAACRLTFDHQIFIVNLVHDAIYADVPTDEAPDIADLISKVMIEVAEEVTQGYVKFATDQKIGHSWDEV